MRALLVMIAMLFCSPAALAQDALEIPAEYKAFFDDYSALMKKHPTVAPQFGMFDPRNPSEPRASNATPLPAGGVLLGPQPLLHEVGRRRNAALRGMLVLPALRCGGAGAARPPDGCANPS